MQSNSINFRQLPIVAFVHWAETTYETLSGCLGNRDSITNICQKTVMLNGQVAAALASTPQQRAWFVIGIGVFSYLTVRMNRAPKT